ncbi:MAG TPA: type II CAAX endopeptidase family protein [bacterium]
MTSNTNLLPSLLVRSWTRVPVVVRAIIIGFVILQIGGFLPGAVLVANLTLSPTIPWFLPLVLTWLWFFWRYLNGNGWPPSTAQQRHQDLRGRPLQRRVWWWSLVAGGLGMVSIMGLIFVTSRFADLPQEAYAAPFNVSVYPPVTVVSIFLSIALVAGVVEEAAFRGYMLSQIQRRHGWIAGIVIVGLMFFVAHLGHAYATIAFLPFFLMYSLLHGYLVYLTRSILSSIVLHTAADLMVLPMQFGVIKDAGDFDFVSQGWLTLVFAIAALAAFHRLATITRAENLSDETARAQKFDAVQVS